MGVAEDKRDAEGWLSRARISLHAATVLSAAQNWHGAVNRSYYAAFQSCVAVCISHGDRDYFPAERNNPTHEQLPDLIKNNGDLTIVERRALQQILKYLRALREDADYRIGRTVDKKSAPKCLVEVQRLFRILKLEEKDDE
ncbi:MAG: HEPN domain-containing protein [Armatimonadetes bacterium]|nr:HEPN domain-containing protein [Armatimonadota bacterium]